MSVELEFQAMQFVLGILPGEQKQAFEEAILHDGEARHALGKWQIRLQALGDLINTAGPPRGVWDLIEQALGSSISDAVLAIRRSRDRYRAALIAVSTLALVSAGVGIDYISGVTSESARLYADASRPFVARDARPIHSMVNSPAIPGVALRRFPNVPPGTQRQEVWTLDANYIPRFVGVVDGEDSASSDFAMPRAVDSAVTIEDR